MGVTVSVFSGVSVLVALTTGVMVGEGTHASKEALIDANDTLSIFGPPSAVSAVIIISFLPAVKFTLAWEMFHAVHAAVDGNNTFAACAAPSTLICMSRSFALPLAYLNESTIACGPAAFI